MLCRSQYLQRYTIETQVVLVKMQQQRHGLLITVVNDLTGSHKVTSLLDSIAVKTLAFKYGDNIMTPFRRGVRTRARGHNNPEDMVYIYTDPTLVPYTESSLSCQKSVKVKSKTN